MITYFENLHITSILTFKYRAFKLSPGTWAEFKVAILNSKCTRLGKKLILLLVIYVSHLNRNNITVMNTSYF
jgi:hypothetical protein